MKERKSGSTSITEYFNLVDKTAGTAKTGITPANLYLAYTRTQKSAVAGVCTALANSASAWLSSGAIEVDSANAPGLYRVDVPDAAWSTGADTVVLTLIATTTSSVAPAMKEVLLVANTSSDNYSLITAGVKASTVVGNVGGSVGSVVGNVGGLVAGSVGSVVGNVGGSVGSVSGNVGGSVAAVLGNVGSVSGGVAGSVGSVVGNVGGSVGSVVGNVGGQVSAVGSAVTVGTNNDKTGYVLSAIGSAAMTEDYAADGATGTLNQMLYMILQNLGDFSITGTVRTVNKLDGATTAMQYSLNSTTAPTATTRAL